MKPVYFLDNGMGICNSLDGKNIGYSIPGAPITVDNGADKKRGSFTSKLFAKILGTKNPND
jgi:hypothetical protein